MQYEGKLYGKVGNGYFPLEATSQDFDSIIKVLQKSRIIIAQMKRSMLAHPDCEVGSEFDDFTSTAQEVENEIDLLIKNQPTH